MCHTLVCSTLVRHCRHRAYSDPSALHLQHGGSDMPLLRFRFVSCVDLIHAVETGDGSIVVLSGLNGKVPLEAMQNRPVVILMNLKPAKMGGIMSNAMVMCAGTDPVEPLDPPAGAVPGDRISFPGISAEGKEPASANLMKKKKILEKLLPDLKTDGKCVACYKGVPFTVEGKGVCTVKSVTDAFIK
eukprot:m.84417 g.84417  ORF g.84417 m.84417 type:complete len:187 (-) comp9594_c0_seq4:1066-1626(-)